MCRTEKNDIIKSCFWSLICAMFIIFEKSNYYFLLIAALLTSCQHIATMLGKCSYENYGIIWKLFPKCVGLVWHFYFLCGNSQPVFQKLSLLQFLAEFWTCILPCRKWNCHWTYCCWDGDGINYWYWCCHRSKICSKAHRLNEIGFCYLFWGIYEWIRK